MSPKARPASLFLLENKMFSLNAQTSSSGQKGMRAKDWVSSVAQSCPTLWDPMDWSTPGLPAHHQLPELTQTHVHWVSNAIQPPHPLPSPSLPALNLSHHLSLQMGHLFASGGQSIGVSASASVPPMNTQDWSPLGWTGWLSLQSKGLSRGRVGR